MRLASKSYKSACLSQVPGSSFFFFKVYFGAGKMAQRIKVLAVKPGQLSPLGPHNERTEPTPASCPLTSMLVCLCAQEQKYTKTTGRLECAGEILPQNKTCTHTYTAKIGKIYHINLKKQAQRGELIYPKVRGRGSLITQ